MLHPLITVHVYSFGSENRVKTLVSSKFGDRKAKARQEAGTGIHAGNEETGFPVSLVGVDALVSA